jgi:hypothetical protein
VTAPAKLAAYAAALAVVFAGAFGVGAAGGADHDTPGTTRTTLETPHQEHTP